MLCEPLYHISQKYKFKRMFLPVLGYTTHSENPNLGGADINDNPDMSSSGHNLRNSLHKNYKKSIQSLFDQINCMR